MTIFVPPSVFDEMQAILDFPMSANAAKQVTRSGLLWVNARNEIARLEGKDFAIGIADSSINTNGNAAVWEIQTFAYEVGVFQVAPEAASIS